MASGDHGVAIVSTTWQQERLKLVAFYRQYNPSKVDTVDVVLDKWVMRGWLALWQHLEKKYVHSSKQKQLSELHLTHHVCGAKCEKQHLARMTSAEMKAEFDNDDNNIDEVIDRESMAHTKRYNMAHEYQETLLFPNRYTDDEKKRKELADWEAEYHPKLCCEKRHRNEVFMLEYGKSALQMQWAKEEDDQIAKEEKEFQSSQVAHKKQKRKRK